MADPRSAKVVHLSTVHRPLDHRIFFKECRSLQRSGFDVTLIVPADKGMVRDGVTIVALPRAHGRWRRLTITQVRLLRRALRERADIYHFHDPELIPLGLMLKAMGRRVVYDVHENLPSQVLTKRWIRPRLRGTVARVVGAVEMGAARRFDLVVAATPTIAARFPSERSVLVQNFADTGQVDRSNGDAYSRRPREVAYVGSISRVRCAEEILSAAQLVDDCQLVVAGKFNPPGLEQTLRGHPGWAHVRYEGWIDQNEVTQLLAGVRVGLVLQRETPNAVDAQPVKLFEYMAAGVPVVASDFPRWRAIVSSAECGLLVDPGDPVAIAAAVEALLDDPAEAEEMGRRGAAAAAARYSWATEEDSLVRRYRSLLAAEPR